VLPRDHREPQRVRHSLPIRLSFLCELEHRLDQRLELERGRDLAEEANLVLAGVPEPVRRTRLDRDHCARPRDQLALSRPQAELALEHLEALGLARMHVRRGDEPVGANDRLDEHRSAAGLLRGAVEDEHLAGHRVLEPVSLANHVCPFVSP
jgi:hypothetical protein